MRVFVTGATGFIGSALVPDLIGAGHQVLGLCRSAEKGAALTAAGAEPRIGELMDVDGLREAAAACDGVVHLAFNHDFSRYVANCEDDRTAIGALAEGLAGSGKPLLVTSGAAMAGVQGRAAREDDPPAPSSMIPRAASEEAAAAAAAQGVRVGVVRLPQVHDRHRQGLISPMIETFRARGVCAYPGEGNGRWAAAHVSDVARLYRLALEAAPDFGVWHAVAEEGVTMKSMAEAIARRLGLPTRSLSPEETGEFFGVFAMFAGMNSVASSEITRRTLGWNPAGPTMIEDLEQLELA